MVVSCYCQAIKLLCCFSLFSVMKIDEICDGTFKKRLEKMRRKQSKQTNSDTCTVHVYLGMYISKLIYGHL